MDDANIMHCPAKKEEVYMGKKLKFAIAGFGNRAYSFVLPLLKDEYKEKVEIVAVLDSNPLKLDFARGALKDQPQVGYFTDTAKFMQVEADLVMITPPQFAHKELACAALDAGHNVFLEKPMARTPEECREIIAAEKRSGKKVFMGFNLRHHPVCTGIQKRLGQIGHIQQMICTDFYSHGYSYFRRWHRLEKNSGGLTVEKGCHSIDLLNMYSGSIPVRVSAFGGLNRFTPDAEGADHCSKCSKIDKCSFYMDVERAEELTSKGTGIPAVIVNGGEKVDMCVFNSDKDTMDNITVIIEYANGCRAVLAECFTSSVKQTSGRQFILNGWDGQIWASLSDRVVKYFPHSPADDGKEPLIENIPPADGNHGGADNIMLNYVIDCLQNNKPNENMLTRDGYYAVAVAAAVEVAVREKRIVEIAPF